MSLCIFDVPKFVRSPGCDHGHDEESRNGRDIKIDILDEGYWSPELFRGDQAMASMTERCFGSPGKCWRASWAKGEGANQPTKGWCAPHTLSHVIWGGGAPPPAWLGGQVSLGFSLGSSNLLGRRPLGETLGRLPLSPSPIYSEGVGGQPHPSPGAALSILQHLLLLRSAWRSPAGEPRDPSPPCCRAIGVLPQLLLSPC